MHLSLDREAYFPRLQRGSYHVTSKETSIYNCIAHAVGRDDAWWWPADFDGVYWPLGVDKAETVECFIEAYATHGYQCCDNRDHEAGYEKVALYLDQDGIPTHAARQLPNGAWSSKLGEWEDIEHATLDALEDPFGKGLAYGRVGCIMKRLESYPQGRALSESGK